MRLILAISSLQGGGAQRVLSTMANHWAGRGWKIFILTLAPTEKPFYALHESVELLSLGLRKDSGNIITAAFNNMSRLHRIRSITKSLGCDVLISFVDRMNILCLGACLGLRIPVIVSERVNPGYHDIGRAWKWLRQRLYPRAGAIVFQTASAARDFSLGRTPRVYTIPNPVVLADNSEETISELATRRPLIIALGRLNQQKGFDLLLRAFAGLMGRFPDWNVLILGEGQERGVLEKIADELRLGGRVMMPGSVANPMPYLKRADIFVLPSRYEGFPNALLEAMACGLPCVSFDCPSGPGEIIEHGRNGLLVPPQDVDHLAETMAQLMEDSRLRKRLGEAALQVRERFSLEEIMRRWNEVIQGCVAP